MGSISTTNQKKCDKSNMIDWNILGMHFVNFLNINTSVKKMAPLHALFQILTGKVEGMVGK